MSEAVGKWVFTKGLHDLGRGCYAYLQPNGSWGLSNAGLVVDGDQSLVVDTLFDVKLTGEMLAAIKAAEPRAAATINTLVNTHANGDHIYGNQLLNGSEIIASKATADEMKYENPAARAQAKKNPAPQTEVAKFMQRILSRFDFDGISLTLPTLTFEGRMKRQVGAKTVQLIQVGPAHTAGDVIVHVPESRTVFAGDILFSGGHPIIWTGPVANWINACQMMLDMDVETVVPGHGPITDKNGESALKSYLEYISAEARKRFDAGMSVIDASRDISLAGYSSWGDAERIAVNVGTLYREFSGDKSAPNAIELFAMMAEIARRN